MILLLRTEAASAAMKDAVAIAPVARTALVAATLWIVSNETYYALVSALDLPGGYDDRPLLFAGYYLGWAALAFAIFRRSAAAPEGRAILREAPAALAVFLAFGGFVVFVLPLLPEVSHRLAPENPPEFMFASAWYYLPKSADILFQQALIAMVVFTAARAGYGLRPISIALAGAFGLCHLNLTLYGFLPLYVARFTLAATAFGALLPYLYLRTPHGFRWALGLHCAFYATDAALTHLILGAPAG